MEEKNGLAADKTHEVFAHRCSEYLGIARLIQRHVVSNKKIRQVKQTQKGLLFPFIKSLTIHGTIVYLPTFGWIFMVNVGKYTSPMDAMGINSKLYHTWILSASFPQNSLSRSRQSRPRVGKKNFPWERISRV